MNKFYKNLILCGDIDFHCLLCEETLRSEADLERHIRWENHRKKLKSTTYFPKFQKDFIVKTNNQYFCEVCNTLLSTAIKTSIHIADNKHIANKRAPEKANPPPKVVSREGRSIKIGKDISINEKEWNTVLDSQCLLCDMDIDNMDEHMKQPRHVINLIQTKLECLDGDKFYKKVGDIFYCFVCKEPAPLSLLESHWASEEHCVNKTARNSAINNGASTSSRNNFSAEFKNNMKKMFAFSDANNAPAENGDPEILGKLKDFLKEGIEINFENSVAVCKKCNYTPNFTVKAITEHIKMHKKAENDSPGFQQANQSSDDEYDDIEDDDNEYYDVDDDDYTTDPSDRSSLTASNNDEEEEKENNQFILNMDHGKIRAELAKFGKQHYMKLVSGGSKGYCTLCDSYISAHIKNFKQHIKGAKHVGHLELKAGQKKDSKDSKEYTTKTLKEYLRNIFFVKQMDDFWINRKICVDKHSFVLLCPLENNGKNDKIKCFVCNDVFPSDKDQAHCDRTEHKAKLFATKVLVSLKREFVREVLPNLFHCGFCNEVCPSWETMKRHLKSYKHLERREQQKMVADMTDDMYGMHMEDSITADTDIMWMQMMGNRLI